ncbi:MAG: PQQ-binding-like beta-propeller repeat protein [Thermoleophilia bacterium]|nr:PQQ-binding-like beta-propeller repeat protein [Thermoleophilia bacterium]
MKKLLLALLLAALAAAGVAGALWYREQTEEKVVRGSPTVEFVSTDAPGTTMRAKREVRRLPWPMYAYDRARTHFAPEFRHRPPYRRLWSFETGAYIEFPPAVADNRLYVANQRGEFIALWAGKGKVSWRRSFHRCIAAGPAIAGGLVYMAVMNPIPCERSNRAAQRGFVIAMDAETGKTRWRRDIGVTESSPLVVDKYVYVGSWDHKVYALDARTGRVRWSYDAGEEVNSAVAYASGTVFIGGDGGHVFALNAWTGKLRWRASAFARFGRREYFYSTPAVAYGRVYIGNTDGTLYAFGARSGRLLWASTAGTYVYTGPAVWRNRVYVGSYDGYFSAFDAATGDRVWRWSAPGAIHGAPTVLAGLVYFSTTSGGIATAKAQRYIKVGRRGTYALDARTGKLVWRMPRVGTYSPIVADERRVYLTGATRVYGLQPKKAKGKSKS